MEDTVKESDITIENDTALWSITHQGEIGGTYLGTFRFKTFLTPSQVLEADRDFRELIGPNAQFAATNAENIAYALAQLKQRVIDSPPFWKDGSRFPGSSIKDLDALQLVLEASIMAEVKYRKVLTEKHENDLKRLKSIMDKKAEMEKINEEFKEKKDEDPKGNKL
jgi:hypothetical protein